MTMNSDTAHHRFSLLERIPPSADLHLAATPFLPPARPQSPIRRQRSPQHELDSFLADLEPSLILEALIAKTDATSTHTPSSGGKKPTRQEFIRNAVVGASPPEKEWGIKAAKAGKSIRQWHDELAAWPWSRSGQANGFQAQYDEDQSTRTAPQNGRGTSRSCIPSSEIREYEMRVEDIRKDLGLLELEDLKGYVRNVHVTPNSKRTPATAVDTASYDHMDDFQAIITAAIVQSLPPLARLNSLMNIWSLRLVIMRLIPDFMQDMASCRDSMVSAHMAIGALTSTPIGSTRSSTVSSQRKSFSRNVFDDMQAVLKDQIAETARKLDTMLDLLEGSIDVLPEAWIDSMDELEGQQNLWAQKAEQVVRDFEGESTIGKFDFGIESQELQLLNPSIRNGEPSSVDESAKDANTKVLGAAFSTSDESDLSNPQMATMPLVRNVSAGVRKPTGVPQPISSEMIDPTVTRGQDEVYTEPEVFNESHKSSGPQPSHSRNGSVDSDFSMGSSPEIQSATYAAYPGSPIQVTTPASSRPSIDYLNISKQPDPLNPGTRKSWNGMPSESRLLRHQRKRSSTFAASASSSPSPTASLQPGSPEAGFAPDLARPRSASIKSFEIVPRSEVRTILVTRSRDSTISLPRASSQASANGLFEVQQSAGLGSSSEGSSTNLTMAQDRFSPDDFPRDSPSHSMKTPNGSALLSVAKSRNQSDIAFSSTSRIPKAAAQRAATMGDISLSKQTKPLRPNNGDRLDAQISSILTKIPADIRLTSSTEAPAASKAIDNSNFPKSRTSHLSRLSVSRLLRSKNPTPTKNPPPSTPPTTLTRAVTSTFSEPRSTNSDIRLYHLHQPGTTSPIKLYVRLVGDTGERVMVRVGGGWADLAEYLKEYASHHGKRAVSESYFNIHNLPNPSSSSSSPANSRPSSSSAPLHRQPTAPTPSKPATDTSNAPSPFAPRPHPFTPRTPPNPLASNPTSPSIRARTWSATSRAASASASDTDVSSLAPAPGLGLAGPKTKNVDISPRKQAWVDGMMRQARRTSGSGSGADGGKVKGGVRRVFLGMSGGGD